MAKIKTKSEGHIGTRGELEFYEQGGEVFAAPIANPLDLDGYRQGGRWEGSRAHFDRYRAHYLIDGDQCCHRCEENLTDPVWLELNSATGEWVEAGSADWSDGPDSQGAFPFGAACARRVLKNQTTD